MYIVGDIAKDLSKKLGSFVDNFSISDLDEDLDYQKLLSRNDSTAPSTNLINYVCNSFSASNNDFHLI